MIKLYGRKLNTQGIAHAIIPLLVVVMVGVIGTYFLVGSNAASVKQSKNTSTYYVYSSKNAYKYVNVSSTGFSKAACGTKKLSAGKVVTKRLPKKDASGKYPPLMLVCTTPKKQGDAYLVSFFAKKPTAAAQETNPVVLGQTTPMCAFVHGNEAPGAKGVTKTYPKDTDGTCKTVEEDAAPEPQKPVKKQRATAAKAQQSVDGLPLPPNFSDKPNAAGYYLLPASPANKDYYVHTATMPGHESTSGSPASQRYGKKTTIAVFYEAALKYNQAFPDSKLVAGDLNAPGHASHKVGEDIDIYSSDRSAALRASLGGKNNRSLELAKILLDTRKIDLIIFNDPSVIAQGNAYAQQKGLPGRLIADNATHDFHFHVRIR